MSDIEREEFEQAVADKWSDSYKFTRFGDEDYYDEILEGMWWGWQASREALDEQGYLNERAQFAEKDAKLMDEMAEELRSLNWAIEACGRDGKIEHEKACQLAKKVIKAAANYL